MKRLPPLLLLLLIVISSHAQTIIGVVDYLKVEDPEAFLALEKEWMKIHAERLKRKEILGWSIHEVMFKTTEDPYNYVMITWYDSFSRLDDGISDKVYETVFPSKGVSYGEELRKRQDALAKRMTSGVFHRQLAASKNLNHSGKYYRIDEINVEPGHSEKFLEMQREIFLPVYKEAIRQKLQTSWGLWAKWTGNMRDYQYVSSGGFNNLDYTEKVDNPAFFRRVHPDLDIESLQKMMESISTKVNSEIWKLELMVMD